MVATDTLAVSGDDYDPFLFTTKAFAVPHLRMIVCGTGAGGFCSQWFVHINDRMLVRDIDHLNYHTTENLRSLWLSYKKQIPVPDDFTTTVYHFGFSEESGVIHSYAYRSANNFVSEPLEYAIGIKPECKVPPEYTFPADIPKMMEEQRAIESSKPRNKRLYIGGEIIVHHLTEHGFNVFTLYRFDDFESDKKKMYDNFNLKKFAP